MTDVDNRAQQIEAAAAVIFNRMRMHTPSPTRWEELPPHSIIRDEYLEIAKLALEATEGER